jgi:hypothetical protein
MCSIQDNCHSSSGTPTFNDIDRMDPDLKILGASVSLGREEALS